MCRAFYFEVIEYVLQKLTLIGLLVFFQRGSLDQLVVGLIVCFLFFGLCCFLRPFSTQADNLMAVVTQFSLFIAMLSAIIMEFGSAETPASVVAILTVAALTPLVLTLVLSVQLAFYELEMNPLDAITRRVTAVVKKFIREPTKLSLTPPQPLSPAVPGVKVKADSKEENAPARADGASTSSGYQPAHLGSLEA